MMNSRWTPIIAMLLAGAVRSGAQEGAEVVKRAVDLSAIESTDVPAAVPAARPVKPERRPKGPTEITAREAMFDNRLSLATFSTEVMVRDPEFGLSCDRLTVTLKRAPATAGDKPDSKAKPVGEQKSGIDKAVAEGNVVITQDKPDLSGNWNVTQVMRNAPFSTMRPAR